MATQPTGKITSTHADPDTSAKTPDTETKPPADSTSTTTHGLKGRFGFPDESGSTGDAEPDLWDQLKVKAPNLTPEFAKAYSLSDDVLDGIARGLIPPPPTIGPIHTTDLYLTPAGWQQTPAGVHPRDVGKDAISR